MQIRRDQSRLLLHKREPQQGEFSYTPGEQTLLEVTRGSLETLRNMGRGIYSPLLGSAPVFNIFI